MSSHGDPAVAKRYQAAIVGLLGGVLYFLVDYGIFYLALGTRVVTGADPFLVFAVVVNELRLYELCLDLGMAWTGDGHALEWSLLIVSGWL